MYFAFTKVSVSQWSFSLIRHDNWMRVFLQAEVDQDRGILYGRPSHGSTPLSAMNHATSICHIRMVARWKATFQCTTTSTNHTGLKCQWRHGGAASLVSNNRWGTSHVPVSRDHRVVSCIDHPAPASPGQGVWFTLLRCQTRVHSNWLSLGNQGSLLATGLLLATGGSPLATGVSLGNQSL